MTVKLPAGALALSAAVLAFALSGCAGPHAAGKAPPAHYAHMNCGQIDAERQALSAQVARTDAQDRERLRGQDVALQRAFSFSQCYRYASL